jgi:hypothetical protein
MILGGNMTPAFLVMGVFCVVAAGACANKAREHWEREHSLLEGTIALGVALAVIAIISFTLPFHLSLSE